MKFLEKELEKIIEKEFIDSEEELDCSTNINDSDIEKNLTTEIRKNSTELKKGNLILQEKINELLKEVKNLNLENENLKKEVFRLGKEEKETSKVLFKILDEYLPLHLNNPDNKALKAIHKKIKNILSDIKLSETASIGETFNSKYHEAVNEITEKKEDYIIYDLVSQGYLKDDKMIRIAKVKVK